MHELVEPSLPVANRLAGVVFLLRVIGIEEAADAWMARPIDVNQPAVSSYTAPPPDVNFGLGIQLARRELDYNRKYVRFGIRIHAGPRRLAAEMRLGEVPFAARIEQVLDPIEVEKERVAAASGEKFDATRRHDVGLRSERDFTVRNDFLSDGFRRARLRSLRHKYVHGLLTVLRVREQVAEGDVREVIAIVIDVEAIDCIGVEC